MNLTTNNILKIWKCDRQWHSLRKELTNSSKISNGEKKRNEIIRKRLKFKELGEREEKKIHALRDLELLKNQ